MGSNPTSRTNTNASPARNRCPHRVFTHLSFQYDAEPSQEQASILPDSTTGHETDEYATVSQWRQTERAQMIGAIHDMIEEARARAKSKRAPASERIRWTRLTGQLIWYKDSIMRNMTLEALEKEVFHLKETVYGKQKEEKPRPGYMFVGEPTSTQASRNENKG